MDYHVNLNPAAQRAFGLTQVAPLAIADRVHHDECDALGHVNNTSYMIWFERVRIRFMEHYAIGKLGNPDDPKVVIRSGEIHWMAEMFRDENYIVTCRCSGIRRTSMSLQQSIWSAGRQRARFDCVMVLLNPDGSGRMPVPDEVRTALEKDGAVSELG